MRPDVAEKNKLTATDLSRYLQKTAPYWRPRQSFERAPMRLPRLKKLWLKLGQDQLSLAGWRHGGDDQSATANSGVNRVAYGTTTAE